MGRLRELVRRVLRPAAPREVKEPPPFVPDPAEEGLETAAADLLARMRSGERMAFIDVRADNEREQRIPDAIHMRIGEVSTRWMDVDAEKTVVCYCASGGQSINAAQIFRESGRTTATCILGGLPAWEDAGGPIEIVE